MSNPIGTNSSPSNFNDLKDYVTKQDAEDQAMLDHAMAEIDAVYAQKEREIKNFSNHAKITQQKEKAVLNQYLQHQDHQRTIENARLESQQKSNRAANDQDQKEFLEQLANRASAHEREMAKRRLELKEMEARKRSSIQSSTSTSRDLNINFGDDFGEGFGDSFGDDFGV